MPIKKHLDQVETWGNFELAMFSNCLFIFDQHYIIYNLKQVSTKLFFQLNNPYFSTHLESFVLNCLIVSLSNHYVALKTLTFETINKLKDKEDYFKLKIIGNGMSKIDQALISGDDAKITDIKNLFIAIELNVWVTFIDDIVNASKKRAQSSQ